MDKYIEALENILVLAWTNIPPEDNFEEETFIQEAYEQTQKMRACERVERMIDNLRSSCFFFDFDNMDEKSAYLDLLGVGTISIHEEEEEIKAVVHPMHVVDAPNVVAKLPKKNETPRSLQEVLGPMAELMENSIEIAMELVQDLPEETESAILAPLYANRDKSIGLVSELVDTYRIASIRPDLLGSEREYAYIDVPPYGSVVVKADDEGIVVDMYYPFEEEPFDSTWVMYNELMEEE